MGNFFLLFLMVCPYALSAMEKQENGEDDSAYDVVGETEISPPARMLPNWETYSFIDCLEPGKTIFSVTRAAGLNAPKEFNDFSVVCYQSDRFQDAYYFVRQNELIDAEKALSIFGKSKPQFYAYLISINDEQRFIELATKSSSGAANKGGEWADPGNIRWLKNLDQAFFEGYSMLPKQRIINAMAAPKQGDEGTDRSWTCGPNTGYRTLLLLDENAGSYFNFVENCPKSLSKEALKGDGAGVASVGAVGMGVGFLLAPFTFGLSVIPGAVLTVTGASAAIIGDAASSDVGPNPCELAKYLSSKMRTHRAQCSSYSRQWGEHSYEKQIVNDIKVCNYPTIVLLINGTFSMHYVAVIGVRGGPYIAEVVILDTDNRIGVMSDNMLEHWMNRDGFANWIIDAKYNTIEIFGK